MIVYSPGQDYVVSKISTAVQKHNSQVQDTLRKLKEIFLARNIKLRHAEKKKKLGIITHTTRVVTVTASFEFNAKWRINKYAALN